MLESLTRLILLTHHRKVGGSFFWELYICTHRTESTSVETVVAFKTLLIRLSRTAQ